MAHYSYMPTPRGVNDPDFTSLLSMMCAGRGWVKMNSGYRVTQLRETPYEDVCHFTIFRRCKYLFVQVDVSLTWVQR